MKKGLLALLGAMLLVPTLIFAEGEKKVDFYGSAQYRLRYRMLSTTYDTTDNTSANDYMDRIAYNFGAKVKVNEKVFMQMELGNWYIGTQAVGIGDQVMGADYMTMFHLAYAKWSQGMFDLTVGLQPLKGTPVLDLLNQSIRNDNYKGAYDYAWAVYQTNRIGGIKLGIPVLKGDRSLSVNLLSSPLAERKVREGTEDVIQSNPSKILWYIDAPYKQGPLSFTPNMAVVFNRNYMDSLFIEEGSDMELAYGFAAGYKLNDAVSFNLGLGMAGYSNENTVDADSSINDADSIVAVPGVKHDMAGMTVSFGTAIKAGPGTAALTVYYNTDEDKEVDNSKTGHTYVDAKYSYAANTNFTIMPRVRVFMNDLMESDGNKLAIMEIRPELIFIGKF